MSERRVTRQLTEVGGGALETFRASGSLPSLVLGAAHPAAVFHADTAQLLAGVAQADVICLNPRGFGRSTPPRQNAFEAIVDDIEAARQTLGVPRWIFWGMSGGGWLAQMYAHRHPDALAGIIVESSCTCFRERLGDPSCGVSPYFHAWRVPLRARGLLAEESHAAPSTVENPEWIEVEGVGQVFRDRGGPALLVAPAPLDEPMRRAMPLLWTFDSRDWIEALRIPTLVIAGGADPVVPVHRVRAIHEAIPNSTFALVPDAGHVPSAERRPVAIEAVRAFLASLHP
jgi:pimeloyl-ACP methyl ester carboxylesterase